MDRILLTETDSNPVISGVLAVMVHAFFLGALALSINWQKRGLMPAVNVELWRELPRVRAIEEAQQEAPPSRPIRAAPAPSTPAPSRPAVSAQQSIGEAPKLPQATPSPPERIQAKAVVVPPPPVVLPAASRVSPAADSGTSRTPAPPVTAVVTLPTEAARVVVTPKSVGAPVHVERNRTASAPESDLPRPQRSTATPSAPVDAPGEIAIGSKHMPVPETVTRASVPESAPARAPVASARATLAEPGAPVRVTTTNAPVPAANLAMAVRPVVTPDTAVTPRPQTSSSTDSSVVAEPKLNPEQRRALPEATVATKRSRPTAEQTVEPRADAAARVREEELARKMQAQQQRREEAKQLAEQFTEEDVDQSQAQVARELALQREEAQKKRQERGRKIASAVREQTAAVDQNKTAQQTDAQTRATTLSLIEAYMARISAKVRSRVVLPPDLSGNPEALYEVELTAGGDVTSTRLRRSSGQPNYDASVERAILAAQPLPVPDDPDLFRAFFARFNLSFRAIE